MTELTLEPGVLRVGAAFPDPPFEDTIDGKETGFDIELMRLICDELGLALHPVEYSGDDFNGIFDGLDDGSYDAVISGTTITPEREQVALFSDPYLEFDQGLVVNVARDPQIKTIDDLHGRVVGIQVGNTSDFVARKLLAEGAIGDIKYYPYHGILTALDDLSAGNIGALIKLFPVVSWLVKERRELAVVQQIPTHEKLGIAFAKTNAGLCAAVNKSLASIKERGRFDALRRKWLDGSDKDQAGKYVITLSGRLEFETRSGARQVVEPGDVLLAEDTSGGGHRWRLVDDQPWRRVYVAVP